MGTVFSIDVRDPGDWTDAIADVVGWLHRVDRVFSTYRPGSDVSRLQRREIRLAEADPLRGRGPRPVRGPGDRHRRTLLGPAGRPDRPDRAGQGLGGGGREPAAAGARLGQPRGQRRRRRPAGRRGRARSRVDGRDRRPAPARPDPGHRAGARPRRRDVRHRRARRARPRPVHRPAGHPPGQRDRHRAGSVHSGRVRDGRVRARPLGAALDRPDSRVRRAARRPGRAPARQRGPGPAEAQAAGGIRRPAARSAGRGRARRWPGRRWPRARARCGRRRPGRAG